VLDAVPDLGAHACSLHIKRPICKQIVRSVVP
jgi:hypothetical protein